MPRELIPAADGACAVLTLGCLLLLVIRWCRKASAASADHEADHEEG
ncbi:hypothetical protein OG898_26355 [Streptomyces sp. NBC_00193]|nr:hypothetical protein [Streptomyces sp. NBC_00193]MCX5299971.1 hypothetical protein [Streptomyces sp. NBC_00193]